MHHVRSLALAGASVMTLATSAWAQQTTPPPPTSDQATTVADTEEIVVTARRRQESVQDVPQVVNAVTSESIEKLNLRKFEDIANVVPGLQMRANANGIGSVTTIRGVNFDVNQSGNNGTVQFYYNEAPLSSNVLLQAIYDVEQVSVERGPQGTLRGRATPSGSINVTLRRPNMTEIGGVFTGTITNIHSANINGAINIPVINDRLAVRGAFVLSDDEGNRIHAVDGGKDLKNFAYSGRATVRAMPFGDNRFIAQYTYQATHRDALFYGQVESLNQFGPTSTAAASPVTIDARDRLAPNGTFSTNKQSFKIHNVNAEVNLFGQKLSYVMLRLKQHFAPLGSADNAGIFGNNQTAPSFIFGTSISLGLRRFGQPTDTKSKDTSQEIRLQNNERVLGMFDYVVGFLKYKGFSETFFDQVISAQATPAPPAPVPTPPAMLALSRIDFLPLRRDAAFDEKSVFGNLTAHIGQSTELSAGARHIWYSANSGLGVFNAGTGTFVDNPLLRILANPEATIWTASAKHNFTRNLMVYVSYGTSWRPQTVVIGGPAQPTAFQAQFLSTAAEKSKNIEAGFKSSWLDRRLTLNVTAYRQKYTGYPYRTGAVPFFNQQTRLISSTAFVTGADVKVKGVEAELAFRPIENWSIGAIVSYADGKLSNAIVPCLDLNNDNIPDVRAAPPTVAEFIAAGLIPAAAALPGGPIGEPGLDTCISNARANNASPWGATLQSEYKHPFNDNLEGFVRGLFTWKGNSLNDPLNGFDDVKSYGILNLYAGVRGRDGAWEVTAYAKNVANTFRVLTRSASALTTTVAGRGQLGPSGTAVVTNYFGITSTEPREFGLTARVSFGSR